MLWAQAGRHIHKHTPPHTNTHLFISHFLWHLNSPHHTPILRQSFNMRHRSCARTAGGGIWRFFNQHRLYELLHCLRYSFRLLPPSSAFLQSVRSCSFCFPAPSANQWTQPLTRTPTSMHPPGLKASMGYQFPDTQWSLNLRGSNPFSLCTRPPF